MSDVSQLLKAMEQGDPHAADQLLPLVYTELRRLAASKLAREQPGQTLQPTALVHEAYLRLVGDQKDAQWDGCGHFFAAAAEAMRRILVESARRKRRHKHGGDLQRVEMADPPAPQSEDQLLAFDEALTRFAAEDPLGARVVELRYFTGAGHEAVATALGMTVYQVRQKWMYARAWFRDALGK
jgi:RNA polymerase sigma factor (TIGR02999 family)